MTALPFKLDEKLTDVLARTRFTLSAEVIPPRNGTEQGKVLNQISTLVESGAQFLAVTKGAGGSLRGGSLPIAQTIKEQFGVPCIAHFTCRDITAHEVENSLMDHHYFGIRNILALRGDPPDGQPDWRPREGGYQYAHQLISQIRAMNEGKYLLRPGGPVAEDHLRTEFCIGAAAYPEHPNEEERAHFFKLKVEAGAQYGITQMIFDTDAYARFQDLCARHGVLVPLLPGTRLLKSAAQARRIAAKFGVSVPASLLARLPETDATLEQSVELFLSQVERFKSLGAKGIHLYVLADTQGAAQSIKTLATPAKSERI